MLCINIKIWKYIIIIHSIYFAERSEGCQKFVNMDEIWKTPCRMWYSKYTEREIQSSSSTLNKIIFCKIFLFTIKKYYIATLCTGPIRELYLLGLNIQFIPGNHNQINSSITRLTSHWIWKEIYYDKLFFFAFFKNRDGIENK